MFALLRRGSHSSAALLRRSSHSSATLLQLKEKLAEAGWPEAQQRIETGGLRGFPSKSGLRGNAGKPDCVLLDETREEALAIIEVKTHDMDKAVAEAQLYAREQYPKALAIGVVANDTEFRANTFKLDEGLYKPMGLCMASLEQPEWTALESLPTPDMAKGGRIDNKPRPEMKDELKRLFRRIANHTGGIKTNLVELFATLVFVRLYKKGEAWQTFMSLYDDDDFLRKCKDSSALNNLNYVFGNNDPDLKFSIDLDENVATHCSAFRALMATMRDFNFEDYFDYDVKGDAYEHFAPKDQRRKLGAFFTPRCVVRPIVEYLAPQQGETCYDPCCGSGGFLTAVYDFIKQEQGLGRMVFTTKDAGLVHDRKFEKLKHATVFGTEIDPQLVRLAKLNMILRGDGQSGITKGNSLDINNPEDDRHDVVVANVPFGNTGENDSKNDGKGKKRTEPKMVERCLKSLKPGGRMAVIVSEGFCTNRSKAFTAVRETLLQQAELELMVQLPQGIFTDTKVRAAILFMRRKAELGKPQSTFWKQDTLHHLTVNGNDSKVETQLGSVLEWFKNNRDAQMPEAFVECTVGENHYELIGAAPLKKRVDFETIKDLRKAGHLDVYHGRGKQPKFDADGTVPYIGANIDPRGSRDPKSGKPLKVSENNEVNVVTIASCRAYKGHIMYHEHPIYASDNCMVVKAMNEEVLLSDFLYLQLQGLVRRTSLSLTLPALGDRAPREREPSRQYLEGRRARGANPRPTHASSARFAESPSVTLVNTRIAGRSTSPSLPTSENSLPAGTKRKANSNSWSLSTTYRERETSSGSAS